MTNAIESNLKVWREKLNNNYRNKELSHQDISSLFQEQVYILNNLINII